MLAHPSVGIALFNLKDLVNPRRFGLCHPKRPWLIERHERPPLIACLKLALTGLAPKRFFLKPAGIDVPPSIGPKMELFRRVGLRLETRAKPIKKSVS